MGHARRQCHVLDRHTADADQPERRRGGVAGRPGSGLRVPAVDPLDDQQRPHGADDLHGALQPRPRGKPGEHGRSHNSTSTPRASTPWTAGRTRSKCTSFTSAPTGNQPLSSESSSGTAKRIWRSHARSGACPQRKARRSCPWANASTPARCCRPTRAFFTYAGSLTTPPCTEGITWYVLEHADRVVTGTDRRVHEGRVTSGTRTAQSRALAGAWCRSIPPRASRPTDWTDAPVEAAGRGGPRGLVPRQTSSASPSPPVTDDATDPRRA